MTIDILIKNGLVLTMNKNREILQNGFVAIKGQRIVAIGKAEHAAKYQADKVIDAAGHIVMPGMINGHTHVPMVLFRGVANDGPKDRIFSIMFPLEKTFITPESCYVGAQLSCMEMIRAGVTCFADMYYFEDAIAKAVDEIGLRAVLGETVMRHPAPDAPEPYGGFEYAKKFISAYKDHPRITPAFAPHAPYTVENNVLQKIHNLAEELDVPILTHLAEMADRPEDNIAQLEKVGFLSKRLIAAHCIYVTENDIQLLKENGVGVIVSMEGNAKSGRKTGAIVKLAEHGVRAGLGTDGPMSSNTQDIFSQMRVASLLQKHDLESRSVCPAELLVEMATIGGAKALHMEKQIGSLEVGKLADVIIVKNDSSHQFPSYDPYQTLVHATFPSDVRTTIVHGKILMDERILQTVDAEHVIKAAQPIIHSIQKYLRERDLLSYTHPSVLVAQKDRAGAS